MIGMDPFRKHQRNGIHEEIKPHSDVAKKNAKLLGAAHRHISPVPQDCFLSNSAMAVASSAIGGTWVGAELPKKSLQYSGKCIKLIILISILHDGFEVTWVIEVALSVQRHPITKSRDEIPEYDRNLHWWFFDTVCLLTSSRFITCAYQHFQNIFQYLQCLRFVPNLSSNARMSTASNRRSEWQMPL